MPARRATSFWLKPWAFIRSHTASRSMQAGCAGATFAGASSADSILRLDLHAHVAMTPRHH